MILREIGLISDPPQPPEGYRPLHDQTRCVSALVERFLPQIVTENEWKISIHLSSESDFDPILTISGVAIVTIERNVPAFFDMDNSAKKIFAIDAIEEGAALAAAHYQWPADRILSALDEARQLDLVNEWNFRPKWNPSRRLRASVFCRHETETFSAELQVEDRQGALVAQKHLFDEIPSEFCFVPRLGDVKWIGKSSVCLYDKAGNIVGEELDLN